MSIQVTLDALPSSSLTLSLRLRDTGTDGIDLSTCKYWHNRCGTNEGFTFSITQASSRIAGITGHRCIVDRLQMNTYQCSFWRNNTVVSLNVLSPLPILFPQYFRDDGTSLSALFDKQNQGGITFFFFTYSLLFDFSGVAGYFCLLGHPLHGAWSGWDITSWQLGRYWIDWWCQIKAFCLRRNHTPRTNSYKLQQCLVTLLIKR
jgi:hypothetical protein